MNYKELQKKAKELGIPANQKAEELEKAINEAENPQGVVDSLIGGESPQDIRIEEQTETVQKLKKIINLPEDASEAQKQYADILNAYVYQNPAKWEAKKKHLIKKLEQLRYAPAPKPKNTNLIIGKDLTKE